MCLKRSLAVVWCLKESGISVLFAATKSMVCGENNICLLKFQISSFYLLSHSHFTICIVALLQFKMDVGNAVDKHLLIIISAIWSLFGAVGNTTQMVSLQGWSTLRMSITCLQKPTSEVSCQTVLAKGKKSQSFLKRGISWAIGIIANIILNNELQSKNKCHQSRRVLSLWWMVFGRMVCYPGFLCSKELKWD